MQIVSGKERDTNKKFKGQIFVHYGKLQTGLSRFAFWTKETARCLALNSNVGFSIDLCI